MISVIERGRRREVETDRETIGRERGEGNKGDGEIKRERRREIKRERGG